MCLESESVAERDMAGNRPTTIKIKLYCPSLSKKVHVVAWEEQRLDLGSIALAFGLDPPTLKLNGHFISRGVDLIASSVTWKSLLSFFSSKRLPTGIDNDNALVVDGKLSQVGTKRKLLFILFHLLGFSFFACCSVWFLWKCRGMKIYIVGN